MKCTLCFQLQLCGYPAREQRELSDEIMELRKVYERHLDQVEGSPEAIFPIHTNKNTPKESPGYPTAPRPDMSVSVDEDMAESGSQETLFPLVKTFLSTGARPGHYFACNICGATMRTSGLQCLKEHMRVHTGERLVCKLCRRTFKYKRNILKHLKVYHPQLANINPDHLCDYYSTCT